MFSKFLFYQILQVKIKVKKKIVDALWSDPKDKNGIEPNEARGGGSCFGPNITEKVLERNNLSLIIRSHECKHK